MDGATWPAAPRLRCGRATEEPPLCVSLVSPATKTATATDRTDCRRDACPPVECIFPVSEAAACRASAVGYREQTYNSMSFFMQAFDGWTLLLLAGQVVLLPRHGFWHILAKYGDDQCGVPDFQPDLLNWLLLLHFLVIHSSCGSVTAPHPSNRLPGQAWFELLMPTGGCPCLALG